MLEEAQFRTLKSQPDPEPFDKTCFCRIQTPAAASFLKAVPLLLANWASSPVQRILIGFRLGNPVSEWGMRQSLPSALPALWVALISPFCLFRLRPRSPCSREGPCSCPVLSSWLVSPVFSSFLSSSGSWSQTRLLFKQQYMPSYSQS